MQKDKLYIQKSGIGSDLTKSRTSVRLKSIWLQRAKLEMYLFEASKRIVRLLDCKSLTTVRLWTK